MWNKLILKLLPIIMSTATPAIVSALKGFIKDLKVKAEATPNPIDNILVEILEALVGE